MRILHALVIIAVVIITAVLITVLVLNMPSSKPLTLANTTSLKPIERVISVMVVNTTLHYVEVITYSPKDFKYITQYWSMLRDEVIQNITRTYSSISPLNLKARTSPANNSVIIEFDVTGKVWVSDGHYTADFLWMLEPLRLDFISNHFKETTHGLNWEGILNGVLTKVEVILPPQQVPYVAWSRLVGHCHGHVWWVVTEAKAEVSQ